MTPIEAGAFLTIDLKAIADNWRSLQSRLKPTECGAVLKADAYGLGADKIAPVLYEAGCRTFFVAYAFEGAALRPYVGDSKIYLLHGAWEGTEQLCADNALIPVLGTLRQFEAWEAYAEKTGKTQTVGLHIDTGMTRFGLTRKNVADFCAKPPKNLKIDLIVSHLACADDPENPKSAEQLALFEKESSTVEKALGYPVKKSLSATDGCRLDDPAFRFDVARPGIALYDNAVRLDARILQKADAEAGQTVGYGATFAVDKPMRFATLGIGYADGFARAQFNRGHVFICGEKRPVVGKVSMDLTVADVTGIPFEALRDAETAEIFGEHISLKEYAAAAGTIDYEALTSLGRRFHRVYKQ